MKKFLLFTFVTLLVAACFYFKVKPSHTLSVSASSVVGEEESVNAAISSNSLIIGTASYINLSDSAKASYLKSNYNLAYVNAIAEVVGVDNLKDADYKKYLISRALGNNSKFSQYMAYITSIESDIDNKGNVISNSRKAKIQKYVNSLKISAAEKYILMGYAGYKNTYGEAQVKSYLQRKGFSKTERELLMSYCGY